MLISYLFTTCLSFSFLLSGMITFRLVKKRLNYNYRKKIIWKERPLSKSPQRKGICLKFIERSPKKPNSAKRKLVLVRLSNKRRIYATIPGGKNHNLQEHSLVLVRGGRSKDVPGLRFKLVRGVYDLEGWSGRKSRRSKYGIKKI